VKRSAWKLKIAISCASLFLSLGVLEIGLRLSGLPAASEVTYALVPPYDDPIENPDEVFERFGSDNERRHPVWVFGDSYTNGGNVRSYHSYPYFLFRMLRRARTGAQVVNFAMNGETTLDAAVRLKRLLEKTPPELTPEAVVVLVGASDPFQMPLNEPSAARREAPFQDVLPPRWKSVRLYQLYRHLKIALQVRLGLMEHYGDEEPMLDQQAERLKMLLDIYERLKKQGVAAQEKRLPAPYAKRIRANALAGEYDIYDIDTISGFASFLLEFASVVYTSREMPDDLFSLLLDVAETFPDAFWSGEIEHAPFYISQTYHVQNALSSAEIAVRLKKGLKKAPRISSIPAFSNFKSFIENREAHMRKINEKSEAAWDTLRSITDSRAIRLIAATYPDADMGVNDIIRRGAQKNGTILVDSAEIFADLILEYGRESYMAEIGHFTPDGNKIFAERVFGAITR